MLGQMISQTKPLKIILFLPFKFSVTNICVAIRLAQDGKQWAAHSFNYPLILIIIYFCVKKSCSGAKEKRKSNVCLVISRKNRKWMMILFFWQIISVNA